MAPLPNPDTYLNHFPPNEAAQFEIFRNLTLVVLGATVWDILVYLPEDVNLVRHRPLHLVTIFFLFSRASALVFVLLSALHHIGPINDCKAWGIGMGVACILAATSTSFLFLQRARAIYSHNRRIQAMFALLWLATSGVMTTAAFGMKLEPATGTDYCTYTDVRQYMAAAGLGWVFFDSFIFFAVSYKIATSHSGVGDGVSWDTIISGKALPRLSRAVLKGGQQYFLLIIFFNLPVGILLAIPSIPSNYRLIMGFPAVSFSSSMACRVFRNMRAEDLRGETRLENEFSDVDFTTFSWFQRTGTVSTATSRTQCGTDVSQRSKYSSHGIEIREELEGSSR